MKTLLPDDRSNVHFYDYGTVKSYTLEGLYFLHRQLWYLRSQVIRCCLFNVRPYQTEKWTNQITWKFLTKSWDPLITTISARDEEENLLLVSLTDTPRDKDFHINDRIYRKKSSTRMHARIQELKSESTDHIQNHPKSEARQVPKHDSPFTTKLDSDLIPARSPLLMKENHEEKKQRTFFETVPIRKEGTLLLVNCPSATIR